VDGRGAWRCEKADQFRHLARKCRPADRDAAAAGGVEKALRMLEGRWKMIIIFQMFHFGILRFSELERVIPGISQKMLIQQLRELERDGIVFRTVYPEVPPKVEYGLTEWGQALCPALDMLLEWAALRFGMLKPADQD
jgi:DNA-binding HxlR family transcriptional regulator